MRVQVYRSEVNYVESLVTVPPCQAEVKFLIVMDHIGWIVLDNCRHHMSDIFLSWKSVTHGSLDLTSYINYDHAPPLPDL